MSLFFNQRIKYAPLVQHNLIPGGWVGGWGGGGYSISHYSMKCWCETLMWNVALTLMVLHLMYFWSSMHTKSCTTGCKNNLHKTELFLRVTVHIIYSLIFLSEVQAIMEYHYDLKSKYRYLDILFCISPSNFYVPLEE